jgi:hypothetical protein
MKSVPTTLPSAHREFLTRAVTTLAADCRLVGVAAAGSYAENTMDEFSDLDLVIAVETDRYAEILSQRHDIACKLGPLLAAFTGEHVGESRLLICLYGPPLLHVDLKFVALADAADRVDEPVVLWERDGRLSTWLAQTEARFPAPDLQWIEDRFWTWVHYAATKAGRGEWLEAQNFLCFLRSSVLGPLGLQQLGLRPAGVRKVESTAPQLASELASTVATLDATAILAALRACIELYRRLRNPDLESIQTNDVAEAAAMDYFEDVVHRSGAGREQR